MKTYSLPFLLLFLGLSSVDQHVSEGVGREAGKMIFRSNDGGQTWMDISEGLPKDLGVDFARQVFSANENGISLRAGDGIYHSKPNSIAPFWNKENFPELRKKEVRNWVESNGVRLTATRKGIMRSTDAGENWDLVLGEGGVITVVKIKGGFAAITYNAMSKTRRVRTSYDGKTWDAIDEGLPPNNSVASIIQVGEYFFCGHPSGIFRSSDKGKTWTLVLPAVDDRVFRLSASGDVIYATSRFGGC